jgi:hypothetical protein
MMFGASGPSITAKEASTDVALRERFWGMELAIDEIGWQREMATSQYEFSRQGLQQIILICRLYATKNPIVKRTVDIDAIYVFGRGIEITSEDQDLRELLEDFLADPVNKREFGKIGLTQKQKCWTVDGNLFICMYTQPTTGRVTGGMIDATEIIDVIRDPDNSSTPWYYRRKWFRQPFSPENGLEPMEMMEAYYPADGYFPAERPDTIVGIPVFWDQHIIHEKAEYQPSWKFGVPAIYSIIDWAKAYKVALENYATIRAQHARWAATYKTKGGQTAMNAFQQALSTNLAKGGVAWENNPTPVTGAYLVTGKDTEMEAFKASNMQDSPEDLRRLLLMVCAGSGHPETFYGDASAGSLATSQTMDRPTELKMASLQEMWASILERVCNYQIERSLAAPQGALKEAWADRPNNRKRVKFHMVRSLTEASQKPEVDIDDEAVVKVVFPSILEHDISARINAIVAAATMNGYDMANTIDVKTVGLMVCSELGIDNGPDILEAMYPEETYDPEVPDEPEPEPLPPVVMNQPGQPGQPPRPVPGKPTKPGKKPRKQPSKEGEMLRALAKLTRAIESKK